VTHEAHRQVADVSLASHAKFQATAQSLDRLSDEIATLDGTLRSLVFADDPWWKWWVPVLVEGLLAFLVGVVIVTVLV